MKKSILFLAAALAATAALADAPAKMQGGMLVGGNGIGRYVGFALGAYGTLDAGAGDIEPTGVLAGFVAWRHVFDPKLRGSLMFSRAQLDNDTDWTGFGVTK